MLKNPNMAGAAHNRNCGDKISIKFLVVDHFIQKIEFDGESCAISQAASQAICEYLEGKHTSSITVVLGALRKVVLEGFCGALEGCLDDFCVVHVHPSRHKCVLLVVDAIEDALFSNVER